MRSAAANCACAPPGRNSTRTPRASSRATTAIATKTSRAAIPIPRLSATLRVRESRRISQRDNCFALDCRFELAGIYRRSTHGFHPAFPDRQALRAQRADQLHAERHAGDEFLRQRARGAAVAWTRRPPTRSSPSSSPAPPPMARPRRMPSAPPAITTTTPWIRTPWARPWRWTGALQITGRWPARCAPTPRATTTTTT